ncbi:MAG: hypothetical protein HQL84_04235 [Magnetococcales bacterium]|nr:hypothetical protein [Magnetococcales bacterium]MBF0149236.1 hypothetical protein [Magnetococcales bacterium]MBF0346616.1 hypothetical protein [Magnetococcales bacterium]MBF0630585.1 hypothetical protein [Magnetococcales bacterium]
MKPHLIKYSFLLMAVFVLGLASQALALAPPVAMLTQVKGTVEISKDKEWKKVTANKFIFEGTKIRTGADGSASIVNQTTNTSQNLAANSEVEVTTAAIKVVSGTLSEPQKAGDSVLASMNQRFEQAQRYTTVRRSVDKKDKEPKLTTAREITLTEAHPDLVWSNMGEEFSYRLIIDEKGVEVPASKESMIRYKVSGLTPGAHKYRVEVVKDGVSVFSPKGDRTLTWLGGAALDEFNKKLGELKAAAPGDEFLIANFLDEKGLTVAAMDMYRKYFKDNPDEVDMFPLLIKTYHDLKLDGLKKEAALEYNKNAGN